MTVKKTKGLNQGSTGMRVFRYAVLLIFVLLFLMPIYVVVVTSLKAPDEVSVPGMWELPTSLSFANFGDALGKPEIYNGLVNSVIVALISSVVSSLMGASNGFVLSKWRFPGANVVFSLMLFGMFIPYQAVLIPMTQFMTNTGLMGGGEPTGGLAALIIAHIVYGLPITTLIFRGYYAGVPDTIFESARVDGAGMLRSFWSIGLPLALPAFAVSIIWQFTSAWNDFLFGVVMTTNNTSWPVTIGLNNIAGAQTVPFGETMAAALIASLPTLLVYIILGRFFMRGLMAGALKG
ncbi:carbohydrate ABC transporter permease [Stackebrandtia nassauensis]|uniref:Binding-protein-dependent transport systems inner membrane component n=1 Tax=Stackebrandtia nassauensis (strain DSM 44728 / CIP 108903 / NRRL B-16338 / NBRC 102104 / LLR-40K-21) TaxID=446470 RepID=D3Q8Y6_STANL|nr:carbohydrate ABC transporter permease [Stackebrandtia nassauensis]ADD40595.1 binding-protein-dependent transport systems inner membrane component [Stackebrandtia nassauensis DSM 44728]